MTFAILLSLLAASPDALSDWDRGSLEVLGWSEDETTVALTFGPGNQVTSEDELDSHLNCKDYSPVSILIVHADGKSERFDLQTQPCVPDAEALKRLEVAKAALRKAGIGDVGGETSGFHLPQDGVSLPLDDAFDFTVKMNLTRGKRDSEQNVMTGSIWLVAGGKDGRHVAFEQHTNGNTGDTAWVEPGPMFVSPKGTTAVIFAGRGVSTMREDAPPETVLLGVVRAREHVLQKAPSITSWSSLTRVELAAATDKLGLFRAYDQAGPATAPCPGYVDALGKPFVGGLSLVVLNGDSYSDAWRIQDDPTAPGGACTSPEVAKQRLTLAKAALQKRGFKLPQKSSVVLMEEKAGRWQCAVSEFGEPFELRHKDFNEPGEWKFTIENGLLPAGEKRLFVFARATLGDRSRMRLVKIIQRKK